KAFRRTPAARQTAAAARWQPLGPIRSEGGYSGVGRVNCVGFHPTDTQTYYIGSAAGGIWKTEDDGQTYVPLTDTIGPFNAYAIAVAPQPGTVFIGGAGPRNLYRSADGGRSWQGFPGIPQVWSILVHPVNGQVVLLATSEGLYHSSDGGAHFTPRIRVYGDMQVLAKPGNFQILYAAVSQGLDLYCYRSEDAGASWVLTQTIPGGGSRPRLATSAAAPGTVEIATCNAEGGLGTLHRSKDDGRTYTAYLTATGATNYLGYDVKPSGSSGLGSYAFAFVMNPKNGNEKLIASVNTWRTRDNGASWALTTHWCCPPDGAMTVHADCHFLGYQPVSNRLFAGNDGGLYQSHDGKTFTDRTAGLAITQIYHIAEPPPTYAPVPHPAVLIGNQDNGTKRHRGGTWTDVSGGDGFVGAFDYGDTNTFYTSVQGGNILRFTGDQGIQISDRIPSTSAGPFFTKFTLNPRRSQTLLVPYQEVFRSYDRGETWKRLTDNQFGFSFIEQVRIAPSDTNVYLAYNGEKVIRSRDGGRNWDDLTAHLPRGRFRDLVFHPEDPEKLYLLEQNGTGQSVFYSADGGYNWTDISFNLPAINLHSIVVQYGTDDLYVCGDFGVYYRQSGTDTWTDFAQNLPFTYLNELKIDETSQTLLVATYGRGLWETPLARAAQILSGGNLLLMNGSAFGPGDSVSLRYRFRRPYFHFNNRFEIQLSDAAGSFRAPTVLHQLASYNSDGQLKIGLPQRLECGAGYRLRIIASGKADTSSHTPSFRIGNAGARPLITASDSLFCPGSTSTLTASIQGAEYQWFRNGVPVGDARSRTLVVIDSAEYSVRVDQPTGCLSLSPAFRTALRPGPDTPVVQVTGPAALCAGLPVQFSTASTGQLQWYRDGEPVAAATGSSLVTDEAGAYTVTATGSGCTSAPSPARVIYPVPPRPVVTQTGNTFRSSAPGGNQWFLDSIAIPGATGSSHTAAASGHYSVQVTEHGCTGPMSAALLLVATSVNDPVWERSIRITPNPARRNISIRYPGNRLPVSYRVFDLAGRKMAEGTFLTEVTLPLDGWAAGTYLLLLQDPRHGRRLERKFVKSGG
ncbi:MAG TPA: T9SS type A sorting domain-containing protein, partial [Chitinophagaceae bacterium]|nr:T9SS type A sorting domain-containing protein [Chitinophagaceae bacterium]